jgi:hypothetical protein
MPAIIGIMLAIGLVSCIGYTPDVLLPLYDGFLSRHYPRDMSFQIYFTSIALCSYLGAALCVVFWRRSQRTATAGATVAGRTALSNPRAAAPSPSDVRDHTRRIT